MDRYTDWWMDGGQDAEQVNRSVEMSMYVW